VSLEDIAQQFENAPEVMAQTGDLRRYLACLDGLGVLDWVSIDLKIVRGLAYYTGIVFELFDAKGELRAICGGGRYDTLLQSLGGVDLPALGFGMGDVVLLELLKARKLLPVFDAGVDVFVLVENETLRLPTLKLIQELRAAGLSVEYSLTPAKPDKQFKRAQELKAPFTARLESASIVRVRNLKTREEKTVSLEEVAACCSAD